MCHAGLSRVTLFSTNCRRNKRSGRKCANAPIGSTINQTDEACTLRRRFNAHAAHADRIALPGTSSSPAGVSSKLNAMTHGRGQSTWIFIIAPSSVLWRTDKLARLWTLAAGMCVSLRTRDREKYEGETRPPEFGLCAFLIAELANATPFPLLSQPTFQICLLSREDSRDARKIPTPPHRDD